MLHLKTASTVLLTTLVATTPAVAQDEDLYPPEVWAANESVFGVSVSPDGNYLSMVRNADEMTVAKPVIEVFDVTEGKMELVLRQNADPMDIQGYSWISSSAFVMSLRQQVRRNIEGFNRGVFEYRLALVDVTAKKVKPLGEQSGGIVHVLPNKPNKVILAVNEGSGPGGGRYGRAFRPTAYYELDLETGNKKLLIRAKIGQATMSLGPDGEPLRSQGYDPATKEFAYYYRPEGESGWQEYYRGSIDDWEDFIPVGGYPDDPERVLVLAHNGDDKMGLWSYNMPERKFEDRIYYRPDFDGIFVRSHSNSWNNYGEIAGVSSYAGSLHTEWFDDAEGALREQLNDIVPNAGMVGIPSRSSDGNTMVIYNSSDHDPGTYFLLKDGALTVLGSVAPKIDSGRLADVRYIKYQSGDGKTVAAYLTIPNANPPYPLVVMPHGGPHVGERVIYDPWAQMLAHYGYAVLQPQYRGSHYYGLKWYQSAFINGSEAGRKMQTDKDDGALFLAKQGIVDEDRMAMVGWSYGGYAALIAASRDPQIYQCVVAGAAVTDPIMQLNHYRWQLDGAQKIEQLGLWENAVAPIDEVEKVNIPMLIVHGDVDARVPLPHATKYRAQLTKFGKDFDYVELEGAAHFYSTLNFKHRREFYTAMLDYLENDCGPDGL